MSKTKITLIVIGILVLPAAFLAYELGLVRVFSPAYQNVQRQVFENTKSYSHGKAQALAKYYDEYRNASPDDRKVIHDQIIREFSSFDANALTVPALRRFLVAQRGY